MRISTFFISIFLQSIMLMFIAAILWPNFFGAEISLLDGLLVFSLIFFSYTLAVPLIRKFRFNQEFNNVILLLFVGFLIGVLISIITVFLHFASAPFHFCFFFTGRHVAFSACLTQKCQCSHDLKQSHSYWTCSVTTVMEI